MSSNRTNEDGVLSNDPNRRPFSATNPLASPAFDSHRPHLELRGLIHVSGVANANQSSKPLSGSKTPSDATHSSSHTRSDEEKHSRGESPGLETYIRTNPLNSAADGARKLSADKSIRADTPARPPTFQELQHSWFAHPSDLKAQPPSSNPRVSSQLNSTFHEDSGVVTSAEAPRRHSIQVSGSSPMKPEIASTVRSSSVNTRIDNVSSILPPNTPRAASSRSPHQPTGKSFQDIQHSWFAHPSDVHTHAPLVSAATDLRPDRPVASAQSNARCAMSIDVPTAVIATPDPRSNFSPKKANRVATAQRQASPANKSSVITQTDFKSLQKSWFAHPDDSKLGPLQWVKLAVLRHTPPALGHLH